MRTGLSFGLLLILLSGACLATRARPPSSENYERTPFGDPGSESVPSAEAWPTAGPTMGPAENIDAAPTSVPLLTVAPEENLLTVAPGENLLRNGDFERGGLEEWTNDGMQVQSRTVHSGNYTAFCSHCTGGISQWVPILPGVKYKLITWMRIDEMDKASWGGVQIKVSDAHWQQLAASDFLTPDNAPIGQWFAVSLAFVGRTQDAIVDLGSIERPATYYLDDVRIWQDEPNNQPPMVSVFADHTSGQAPLIVNLTAQAQDLDGAIDYVEWDFGDGGRDGPPRGLSTHHTFIGQGIYEVRVTVFDDEGAAASDTLLIAVQDSKAPKIEITSPLPQGSHRTAGKETRLEGTVSAVRGLKMMRWFSDRGHRGEISLGSHWAALIELELGENRIWVTAEDDLGKLASDDILVEYMPADYTGPQISTITANTGRIEQYDKYELTFNLHTVATNLQFPYDEHPPRGIRAGIGISVDGLFSSDGGQTWLTQPGFLYQDYQRSRQEQGGQEQEHLYPVGDAVWKVRFGPQTQGTWWCKIRAQDKVGTNEFPCGPFEVTAPSDPLNHGFVRVSDRDPRYFEFSDGTTFIGVGHNEGVASTFEWEQRLQRFGENRANFFRIWQSGQSIYMAPWNPWNSHTLPFEGGYFNAPALTYAESFADHLFSLRLWDYADPDISQRNNPCMFQGFDGRIAVKPNTTYQLVARLKLVGVSGPRTAGHPFGFSIRSGGWLGEDCSDPNALSDTDLLLPHVSGSKDWHEVTTLLTTGNSDRFLNGNLYLTLENTTGGDVYVDQVSLREWDGHQAIGPEVLRKSRFDYHNYYDQEPSWRWDYLFDTAQAHGIYIRPVILEKNDWIASHLGPYGNVVGSYYSVDTGHFHSRPGTMIRRLHEYYLRYQIARWGYARSLHSFELLNEANPNDPSIYAQANDLGNLVRALDPNKHLVTTSTWFGLLPDFWRAHQAIDSADWHAYLPTSEGCNDLEDPIRGGYVGNDAALGAADFSIWAWQHGIGKPITRGEVSIISPPACVEAADKGKDIQGVWLHNFVWAGINPGGMYDLYWDPVHIRQNDLYHIYRPYRDFMDDIPLSSGCYRDAGAESSNENLRVWGQKEVQHGGLHLWVQNRNHTWRNVVDSAAIPAESGTIRVGGFTSGQALPVEWWDTWPEDPDKGIQPRTDVQTVDAQGYLEFQINTLRDDLAIRILPDDSECIQPIVMGTH